MSKPLKSILLLAVLLIALALLWQWLSAEDILSAERLTRGFQYLARYREAPWILPVVVVTYCLALLTMFPLTVLVMATGLLFGPWWGLAYAVAGTLASSTVSYWIGRHLGREVVLREGGARLNRVLKYFARRGILTMILVNLVPLVPFTLTNMLAGAFRLRFGGYLLGSVLGITPGLVAAVLLGSQLAALVTAGGYLDLLLAFSGVILAIVALIFLRRYAARRQRGMNSL